VSEPFSFGLPGGLRALIALFPTFLIGRKIQSRSPPNDFKNEVNYIESLVKSRVNQNRDHYSMCIEGDIDILKTYYRRQQGGINKSKKFKFKRLHKKNTGQ